MNLRVIQVGEDDAPALVICEVIYDENDVPVAWREAARPTGSTFAELQLDLDRMSKALKQPRLTEADFAKGPT